MFENKMLKIIYEPKTEELTEDVCGSGGCDGNVSRRSHDVGGVYGSGGCDGYVSRRSHDVGGVCGSGGNVSRRSHDVGGVCGSGGCDGNVSRRSPDVGGVCGGDGCGRGPSLVDGGGRSSGERICILYDK
jgi:hypothetical protein